MYQQPSRDWNVQSALASSYVITASTLITWCRKQMARAPQCTGECACSIAVLNIWKNYQPKHVLNWSELMVPAFPNRFMISMKLKLPYSHFLDCFGLLRSQPPPRQTCINRNVCFFQKRHRPRVPYTVGYYKPQAKRPRRIIWSHLAFPIAYATFQVQAVLSQHLPVQSC